MAQKYHVEDGASVPRAVHEWLNHLQIPEAWGLGAAWGACVLTG